MFAVRLLIAVILVSPLIADQRTVDSDPHVDFSKFHSFAIRRGNITSKKPQLDSPLIKTHIEDGIRAQLRAKRLEESEQRPDLIVNYRLGSADRREVETWPAGRWGLGRRRVSYRVTEGTLVIDLLERDSRDLVWRGVYTDEESNADKLSKKLGDDVKKLFEKYPPEKK